MANDYPKINTLFLRDEKSIIIPDSFTTPEFEFLKDCKWECTEKIDGTNIHIDFTFSFTYQADGGIDTVVVEPKICGRTSKAVIPKHLLAFLERKICYGNLIDSTPEEREKWHTMLQNAFGVAISSAVDNHAENLCISLYGEGFGKSIQAAGGRYLKDGAGFILFDVRVNGWWLKREDCQKIAEAFDVPIVPLIGYMSIPEAMEYVKKGFKSNISEDPALDAEGLVLKTPDGLMFRNGSRIITKLKTSDFRKYHKAYGDTKVEQTPNPHYNKDRFSC